MKQKRSPKKPNVYFTQQTEDAIVLYNSLEDDIQKNILYTQKIHPAFYKLAEIMIHRFKFYNFDVSHEDVKHEVIAFLHEKINKYKAENGKAFSYFSIVAKNHLILKNNGNYKRFKKTALLSEMPESWNPPDDFHETQFGEELNEFKELMLKYWDINLTRVFTKKRDIQIADAVLELFRRSQHIENFNKKHLYLLIREMTDCKTHYITKVVNEMKKHQVKMLNDYLDHGMITSPSNEFWEEEYL